MVLQRKLRPSIARVNVQLDPRYAASKHTTAPINHTRPSPRKHSPDVATRARKQIFDCSLLLIYRPRKDERLSWPGWLVTYRNKVPPPGVEPRHVNHPSTNRARRRVTSLIRPTPLPLRHATDLMRSTSSPGEFLLVGDVCCAISCDIELLSWADYKCKQFRKWDMAMLQCNAMQCNDDYGHRR